MSYMKHLALDTRTCGEADEDAQHDKRDGLTTRITTNHARWAAAHKRLDEMDKSAIMATVVQAIWDEHDAHTCAIEVDDGGYYIVSNGTIITSGLISAGDAVEEAEAECLTILNMDEVERWMQPPDDWGIRE